MIRKQINKASGAIGETMPWLAFALALLGGCAMALTFAGGMVGSIVRVAGDWVDAVIGVFGGHVSIHLGMVIAVGWGVGALFDIGADGVPNRVAMWAAVFVPSIASYGLSGRLGDWARHQTHTVAGAVNNWASVWLGGPGLLALAAVGIYLALRAQKKVRGGRGGAAMPVGMR